MLACETRLDNSLAVFKPTKKPAKCKIPLFRSTKGASKQRRDLINTEITRLRDLLPLPESARQRLSQLQVMSLCCVYVRKCNYFARLFGSQSFTSETNFDFSQSMNGFLMTITKEGKLLYISENVTEYLGHSMVDMLTQGDSVYDIVDKKDHGVLQSKLMQSNVSSNKEHTFFCRMNVSRSFRRQGGYGDHKVMHVRGHFVNPMVCDQFGNQPVFIAVCSPLITPDAKESVVRNNTMVFQSVHGLDMKYMEIGHNGEHHLGYSEEEIDGKSWYELLHPEDLAEAKEKHSQLIKSSHEMGCMLTVRLMTKSFNWVSVNVVMHIKQPLLSDNSEPAIVCINHVIREPESQSFRHQSQLYSSHIARSPEIFGSAAAGSSSPQHTITQVPLGGDADFLSAASSENTSFQGEFQMSLINTTTTGGQRADDNSSRRTMSISSDSGSDMDQKQMRRANVISRLKRKMSESGAQCKPLKTRKFSNDSSSGGSSYGGGQPMVNNSGSLLCENVSDSLLDGLMQVQNFGGPAAALDAAPVFSQLNDQITKLNPKEQLDMLLDVQQIHSPLTPESDISDLTDTSAMSEYGTLTIDVNDAAVVPASILTPDSCPSYSPVHKSSSSSNPQLTAALLSALEETSFFANMKSKATKLEAPTSKLQLLPELDPSLLENVFGDMDDPSAEKVKEEAEEEEEVNGYCKEEESFFGISEGHVASMVASMSESLLDLLPVDDVSVIPDDFDAMTSFSVSTEDSDLPEGHGELLHELHQLNQLAANSSPSYGDKDLADALFDSTL